MNRDIQIHSGVNLGTGTVFVRGMESELLLAASDDQLRHLAQIGAITGINGIEPEADLSHFSETGEGMQRILAARSDFPMTQNSVENLQDEARLRREHAQQIEAQNRTP